MSGGTRTQPANDELGSVINVPTGWTLTASGYGESNFLLTAPASYGFAPTRIQQLSSAAAWPNATPSQALNIVADSRYFAGSVQTCSVNGDPAAFVQEIEGSYVAWYVLWVQSHIAEVLILSGQGGLDPRAIGDAKGVIASWTATASLPSPSATA